MIAFMRLPVLSALVFTVAFDKLCIDVLIRLASIPPMDGFADEVEILEWVCLCVHLVPIKPT